jgi:hypothetical protein
LFHSLSLDDNRGRIENKLNQKLSQLLHYHLRVALSILLSTIVSLLCPGTVPPLHDDGQGSSSLPHCVMFGCHWKMFLPAAAKGAELCANCSHHTARSSYIEGNKKKDSARRSEDR